MGKSNDKIKLVIIMKTKLAQGNFYNNSDYSIVYKSIYVSIPTHWHNFYEFDIILSGKGETVCNGKKYELKRGAVSLLSPLDFHGYKCDEHIEVINVHFHERDINYELLDRLSFAKEKVIFLSEKSLNNVEKLCELLRNSNKGAFSEEYRKKLTECLIITFLNSVQSEKAREIKHSGIKKAVVYLNTHFAMNPSMKEMADKFYLNPSYFSRAFKEHTGLTYKEYLRRLKLEYSSILIKNTELPLIDIVVKSGYETQSHFIREFKSYYKITPMKYREMQR